MARYVKIQIHAPKPIKEVKTLPKQNDLYKYGIDIRNYKNGNRYLKNGKEKLLEDYNAKRIEEYNNKLNLFQQESDEFRKEFVKSHEFFEIKENSYKHFSNSIYKHLVFEFIINTYDLTIIPTTIWQKLDDIYSGTFRGMTVGIPPSDLLDMWKRKIDMLNDLAKKNETNGVPMQPEHRLTYDLSVLINKYDSYLRWKEKQKILEAEKETEKSQNIVSQSIGYTNVSKDSKADTDDISGLVDDIFG